MTGTGFTVEFAAPEPQRLAHWWAQVLRWTVGPDDVVRPTGPGVALRFTASAADKAGKNSVHLQLRSESYEHQRDTLLRLFNAGARFTDEGEDVPWQELTDPAGNELRLLEPRKSDVDTGPVASVVVGSPDPAADSAWWVAAGLQVVRRDPALIALHSTARTGPFLEFALVGPTIGMLRVLPEL